MATLLTQSPSETEVVRYGFLLLPEFPMYALIPAIEALRVANQNKGRKLYSWHLFSADGRPVKAGNGMASPGRGGRRRRALVSDGLRPAPATTRPITSASAR
jgi:transcriptional regulator GlxA family with amidase domain